MFDRVFFEASRHDAGDDIGELCGVIDEFHRERGVFAEGKITDHDQARGLTGRRPVQEVSTGDIGPCRGQIKADPGFGQEIEERPGAGCGLDEQGSRFGADYAQQMSDAGARDVRARVELIERARGESRGARLVDKRCQCNKQRSVNMIRVLIDIFQPVNQMLGIDELAALVFCDR